MPWLAYLIVTCLPTLGRAKFRATIWKLLATALACGVFSGTRGGLFTVRAEDRWAGLGPLYPSWASAPRAWPFPGHGLPLHKLSLRCLQQFNCATAVFTIHIPSATPLLQVAMSRLNVRLRKRLFQTLLGVRGPPCACLHV